MRGRTRRSARRDAHNAEHDRPHRQVLAPAGVLMEHAPAEVQQHEQPHGQRRLHHHQRGEVQRHHLQRPAEHRQAGAGEPAPALHQVERERRVQVL